ncbi:MAG: hypothetical protein OXG39_01455 [Chloroflexi bacterium]|nr:hypothetical protein [Chloroflexota bacterium]
MNLNLRATHVLSILMLVAYLLRLLLIVNGGQFYFPDESRYQRRSVSAADTLFQADFRSAIDKVLAYNKHHGFTAVGLVPAIVHRVIFFLSPPPGFSWTTYWLSRDNDYRVSALIFAIPSVLSIGMIYLLARRAGTGETEALVAAFLLAASNTFFIFSKHFLPYDSSLLIGLAALWLAIPSQQASIKNAIPTGIATFLCIWVYFGHITFVLMIALVYCGFLASNWRDSAIRASGMAFGALLIATPLFLYNNYVLGINVVSEAVKFSETVSQGEYFEGSIFPILYLGNVEAGVALVWMIGVIIAAGMLARQPQSPDLQHVRLWLACLIILYLLMVLFSAGLQMFVVYGRIARTLVPFLVMLSAFVFTPWLMSRGKKAFAVFVGVISILALANFVPAIRQEYFIEIARRARLDYGEVSYETMLRHPALPFGVYGEENPLVRYKLLNAGYYYPITEPTDLLQGKVLMQVAHPFNHRPWQYEGMTREMRDIVNRDEFYIWLIDKGSSAEA